MRPNTEDMIRAAVALQVAALEFDGDDSPTQFEARQAIIGMSRAIDNASNTLAMMRRASEARRHGK